MVSRKRMVADFATLAVFAFGIGMAFNGAVNAAPAQIAQPAPAQAVTIPYSGRLTDSSGQPVADGAYDMRFELYDAETGGQPLWSETQLKVLVKTGSVDAALGSLTPLQMSDAGNSLHWLAVSVRGPGETEFTLLTPRQQLSSNGVLSPSALTCPHSHFSDGWSGSGGDGLVIANSSSYGDGLHVQSNNIGTNNGAVYARNGASTGYGDAINAYSLMGVGVRAASGSGDGLEATTSSTTTTKSAIYAHAVDGNGVWAISSNSEAVHGGSTASYGVRGDSTDSYGGYFYSENFRALYASSSPGWYAGYFANRGGSSSAGLYVDGTLYVTGAKSGYVTDLAMNDGPEPLETGDVVVVTGYGDPVMGQIPLVKVRKSSVAQSSAVIGIVDQPMAVSASTASGAVAPPVPAGATARKADRTSIAQGQYLSIVTLGSYKAVKVDAAAKAIQPGDLLVASSNPGYAMVTDDPRPGTIIGKAMGALGSGTGVIPLMVTLH